MTFDPFSILPDPPSQPGTSSPPEILSPPAGHSPMVRALPASMVRLGVNGNNMPANVGEELETKLAERRQGRMSGFTTARAIEIIEGLEDGKTMAEIAREIGITRGTIWTWMQLSQPFSDSVARAREYQGHAAADQAVEILDKVAIDSDTDPKLAMAQLRKAEQRARIRMELAKAFNFKQYGEKKQSMNLNINADAGPVDLSKYA